MQSRYETSNPKRQDISSLIIETVQNMPVSSSGIIIEEENSEMNHKRLLSQSTYFKT
jgi:hypothetical protein